MQIELFGGLTLARPFWLLLLIPGAALCWLLYRRINHYSPWHNLLPAVMRTALLQRQPGSDHAGRFMLLGAAWLLTIIALSGPVWEGEPPVMRQNQSALVIVLDLSHSMLANDLVPTRLERARLKIRDLLQMRSDSQVALVAFAGSAHRVTPLSTDQSTLLNLLAGLSPGIMPLSGSDPGSALQMAEQMIAPLPPETTQILLITGSVGAEQLKELGEAASRLGQQLSILGAGTAEGAPVALPEGGFMRDEKGRILLPRLDNQALATIARRTGAGYHDITRDDSDLLSLLRPLALSGVNDPNRSPGRSDQGHWLILLLLPLAALGARRGWLGLLLCAMLLPTIAKADTPWRDLWQRPDQQAAELLAREQPAAAAERFEDPHWIAWALYQAGDYAGAAAAYQRLLQLDPDNPQHHFDHGTALAMSGELEDALEAYEQTLTRAPDHAAARHNRSRIEALLEERERQAAEEEPDAAEGEAGDKEAANGNATEDTASEALPDRNSSPRSDQQDETASPDLPAAISPVDPAATESDKPSEALSGGGTGSDTPVTEGGKSPAAPVVQQSPPPDPLAGPPEPTDTLPGTLDSEQQAALQQWLREVPDNPAELLRRKFLYQRLQQLEERSQ
ncbi:VWA domain-containing protein [Halopseudomonas sp.]|uniref:VWA domain-containing protein n=1 Tax=Halopseudomonas sp. TaxID=2901191 RepID=UPI003566A479